MKILKKMNLLAVVPVMALSIMGVQSVSAMTITRQLELGMRGSDIGAMQTFFKQDSSIYPEGLVTDYFGSMTKSAVINFQARNGIATVGRVGPQTLPVLNAAMANGSLGNNNDNTSAGGLGIAPIISYINVYSNGSNNSVNVSWSTNELARGIVYYSTSPLFMYENQSSLIVTNSGSASTDSNYLSAQNVLIQNLQNNVTYYYMIYTADQNGNISVSVPATFRIN